MSNSVFTLSKGAACEAGKLIVQVVGKDHPTTQKLAIYDKSGPVEGLTQQDKPEFQNSDTFSSVLHVWDWESKPGHKLCLEIETTEGKPICLTLHEDLRTTPRQPEHALQWNQIVPVVPMTALPGSKNLFDLGTPVSLRDGYVYVFYRGKLWRELEVRNNESAVTYHDVNVSSYRSKNGFKSGTRKAVGVGLEEIWLPSQWNNREEKDLQVFFSEIQLSAPRLAFLEKDSAARKARASQRQLNVDKDTIDKMFKGKPGGLEIIEAYKQASVSEPSLNDARTVRMNMDLWAFPLVVAAPQRSRQAGYEQMLDNPSRHVCDLTGQFPVNSLVAANAFVSGCQAGQTEEAAPEVELGAVGHVLQVKVAAKYILNAPDLDSKELWQAQPAETDVFASQRSRQLCAILLDDSQFRIRHLMSKIADYKLLLEQCAEYAKTHAHFGSAMLLQQTVVPKSISGEQNKLHKCIGKMTASGRRDVNRFVATIERMEAWKAMQSCQKSLVELMEKGGCQQTMADHLSLDEFEYTSAIYFYSQVFSSIGTGPSDHDPLAIQSSELVDAVNGRVCVSSSVAGCEFIMRVAENEKHPLHRMFWPKFDLKKLEQPYVKPAKEENRGDGALRTTALAEQELMHPPKEAQFTIDAALLQSLLASGSLTSTVIVDSKAIANALISIYEHLKGALEAAHIKLTEAQQSAAETQQQSGKNQPSSQEESGRQQQTKTDAEKMENITRAKLAAEARLIKIRLHGMSVELLRSILTEHFGGVVLARRGVIDAGDYYIFALSELPIRTKEAIRMYGELKNGKGEIIGDTNEGHAKRKGLPDQTDEHLVAAIRKTDKTTALVEALDKHKWEKFKAEKVAEEIAKINSDLQSSIQTAIQKGKDVVKSKDGISTIAKGISSFNRLARLKEMEQAALFEVQQSEQRIQMLTKNVDAQQRAFYFRALNSGAFPLAVLGLELWNISVEWEGKGATEEQKGEFRAIAGVGGAFLDGVIAIEFLASKMKKDNWLSESFRKTRLNINMQNVPSFFKSVLAGRFITKISLGLILMAGSSFILMVNCIIDAVHAWRWRDNAAWGYGVMVTGAFLGIISPFFSGSAALIGLNPFGLASLLLIVLGAGLAFWFSSTQLEDWLECGPFGATPRDYLAGDAHEAFYRLLGIFSGIRIAIESNPYFQPNAKLDMTQSLVQRKISSANTRIRVSSNLPGLLSNMGYVSTDVQTRLCIADMREGIKGPVPVGYKVTNPNPVLIQEVPSGKEIYVNQPNSQRGGIWESWKEYKWAVRAQFRIPIVITDALICRPSVWLFPAPPVRSNKVDAGNVSVANFEEIDIPFWADERTHAES